MLGLGSASYRTRCGSIKRQRGFTLIELLAVLVILGLISALVAPRVFGFLGRAKHETAGTQIDRLDGILDIYRLETGTLPSEAQGLGALLNAPQGVKGWNGPYIKKAESLIDPWGNPYIYRNPGSDSRPYEITSLGADGRPGGTGDDADLSNWQ